MGVSGFPSDQHLVNVLNNLRVLFLHFGVGHVAVSYKMVSLLASAFRGGSIKELLPGVHALADMHAAVVDNGALDNIVAAGLQDTGHAVSQKVVADMPKVKGLVGVGGREFHHYATAGGGQLPVIFGL